MIECWVIDLMHKEKLAIPKIAALRFEFKNPVKN
jgi:hypothetical protein